MKAVHFGGEIGYTEQEKFSVLASINLNKYFDIQENDKAFGLIPFEMKGTARVQIIKDLWLKTDVFLWDGAQYKTPSGNSAQLDGSFDLNAGLEFRITKNLNLWAQFNNILNREYEPWKLYRSYGFNFLGGHYLRIRSEIEIMQDTLYEFLIINKKLSLPGIGTISLRQNSFPA